MRTTAPSCPFCGAAHDNAVDIRRDRWSHQCPRTSGLRVWWNATHWSTLQEMKIVHLRPAVDAPLAKVIELRPA